MALIDDIRAQYPHPRRAYDDDRTHASYCVGGSLCMFAGIRGYGQTTIRFPCQGEIATALLALNPSLDDGESSVYATDILYENDTGHFEAAWAAADKALTQNDREE